MCETGPDDLTEPCLGVHVIVIQQPEIWLNSGAIATNHHDPRGTSTSPTQFEFNSDPKKCVPNAESSTSEKFIIALGGFSGMAIAVLYRVDSLHVDSECSVFL